MKKLNLGYIRNARILLKNSSELNVEKLSVELNGERIASDTAISIKVQDGILKISC